MRRCYLYSCLLLTLTACVSPRPARLPPLAGQWKKLPVGQSLAQLAARERLHLSDLVELNGLQADQALTTARWIFVPRSARIERPRLREHPTASVARSPQATEAQPLQPQTSSDQSAMLWPVGVGRLSSRFGERHGRPHEGIDIGAPAGTAVVAADDGVVLYAGSHVRGYGNLILIQHANNIVTVYAHNRRNLVKRNARVSKGQVIAEVGSTGRARGSHLHFEVRRGEEPLDPLRFVSQPPAGRRTGLAPVASRTKR
ncbi:MAG: M23 family metallopeptidase [Deltaproteobacteria bacterium]|nr:M23 family metallopeptidase [Deltaproteobacteria bacterium]